MAAILLGGFFGGDAHGAARLEVDESGGDFAPVAEFQGALAEAAVGDERDGIGDAAINFNVRNDALALGDGIVDAKFAHAKHGQAHAEDLAGAQMPVSDGRKLQIFGQGFHFIDSNLCSRAQALVV